MDGDGGVVVRRLHRMVRAGFRPWLGYAVAGGGDRDIELRRRDGVARLGADGAVTFEVAVGGVRAIAAADAAGFDLVFPPDMPNRRNLVRRLYEIGVGAW